MNERTKIALAATGFATVTWLLAGILKELEALNERAEDMRSIARERATQIARSDGAPSGVQRDLERIFSQRVI